jgi:hypothetical protein
MLLRALAREEEEVVVVFGSTTWHGSSLFTSTGTVTGVGGSTHPCRVVSSQVKSCHVTSTYI